MAIAVEQPAIETADEPRRRRTGKPMPVEEVHRLFPSLKHLTGPAGKACTRAWVAAFNARPDAMHAILADFIKQTHATPGRIGQRPMPKEEVVDFEGLVYGESNELPLIEALPKAVKALGLSERQMCAKVHMSRTSYRRMLRGEYHPDVRELRLIAEAINRPPTFFVEYTQAMAVAALLSMLKERPALGNVLYRQFLEAKF